MDGNPDLPPQSDEFGPPPATFAPPTATSFSPPMAPYDDAPISVVMDDEPKKKRTGLFVGVGVLAVAAIAAGAFFLLGGEDKETYSLNAATAAAAEQDATSFVMTIETMGQEISMEAEIDNVTGVGRIVMDVGAAAGGTIEMIIDTKGETAYMSSEVFESIGVDIDTPWIRMDKQYFEDNGNSSVFDTANSNSAVEADALLENAESVEDLGIVEIDGEKLKHYRVTLDIAKAFEASPGLEEQLEALDSDIPFEDIVYEMYVTEDNILRKMTFDLEFSSMEMSMDMTVKDLDQPPVIEIPGDDEVTDAADLF